MLSGIGRESRSSRCNLPCPSCRRNARPPAPAPAPPAPVRVPPVLLVLLEHALQLVIDRGLGGGGGGMGAGSWGCCECERTSTCQLAAQTRADCSPTTSHSQSHRQPTTGARLSPHCAAASETDATITITTVVGTAPILASAAPASRLSAQQAGRRPPAIVNQPPSFINL